MATKEDYCDFETAKLLKEKGFDGQTRFAYTESGEIDFSSLTRYWNQGSLYACPSQSMAMRWLREVHGLFISLEPCYDYDSMHVIYLAFVQNVADVHEFMDGRKNVASNHNAEKSCWLAIKYCLEHLI